MNTADYQLVGPAAPLTRVAQAWNSARTGARAAWLAAGVVVMIVAAGSAEPVSTIVTGWCLLAAAMVDVRELRLPNELLLTGGAAAMLGALAVGQASSALAGGAIAAGLMLWVRVQRGLGMGDVKMGAVIGASVAASVGGPVGASADAQGVLAAPLAIAVAAFVAATWGLARRRHRLPLGPALWIGWAVALLLPEGWWR